MVSGVGDDGKLYVGNHGDNRIYVMTPHPEPRSSVLAASFRTTHGVALQDGHLRAPPFFLVLSPVDSVLACCHSCQRFAMRGDAGPLTKRQGAVVRHVPGSVESKLDLHLGSGCAASFERDVPITVDINVGEAPRPKSLLHSTAPSTPRKLAGNRKDCPVSSPSDARLALPDHPVDTRSGKIIEWTLSQNAFFEGYPRY